MTIADVAKSVGLSTCTVSRVLNESFDGFKYSPQTIEAVKRAAKEMGYRANPAARGLRTKKSYLIGLILPTAQSPFFGGITDGLEMELRARGYQLLAAHSRDEEESEEELVRAFLARGVDGLLWVPVREKIDRKALGISPEFPMVILDRPDCDESSPLVATDNLGASRTLALKLQETGHEKVLVFNAPFQDRSMTERAQGLAEVFGGNLWIRNMPNDPRAAREAISELLSWKDRPSALVVLSELLAIGALSGLRDCGLAIPRDISFASFDDFLLASHWSPRITAIRQDIDALTHSAIQLLMEKIKSPDKSCQMEIRVPANLEWRESVGVPHP